MALPPSIFDALREFSRIQYKTKLFETLNNEKLQERVKIGSVITTRPVIAQNRPYGSNEAGIPGLVTPFDIQRQSTNPTNYIPEAPLIVAHQFIPAATGGSSPPTPTPTVTACNVSLTAITGVGSVAAFANISGGGDTFDCYNSGVDLNGLNYGTYFSNAWVSYNAFVGIVAYDSYDTYSTGVSISGLSAGNGFSNPWFLKITN